MLRRKASESNEPQELHTASDKRRRRTGWDNKEEPSSTGLVTAEPKKAAANEVTPPLPRMRIQSYEEILREVQARAHSTSQSAYSGITLPARPLYAQGGPDYVPRGDVYTQASPEVLTAAKERALEVELAGKQAAKQSGQPPKGPPGLPTGTMVIEQKYVDFIIGPGGQSLAAINYAAGVNVHLDQSNKFAGYTVANIYGPEDNAKRAKVAIEFKVSQWLPRPGAGMLASPGASVVSRGSVAPKDPAVSIPPQPPQLPNPPQPPQPPQPLTIAAPKARDAARPPQQDDDDDEELPPGAMNDPLVKALAKWPSLARSAARAAAIQGQSETVGGVTRATAQTQEVMTTNKS